MDLAQDAWNGSKFEGSFGPITDFTFVDYWTLRKRSLRLFKENLYAKGIIRRLLWNEIQSFKADTGSRPVRFKQLLGGRPHWGA